MARRKFCNRFIYSMRPYEPQIIEQIELLCERVGTTLEKIDKREMVRLWIIHQLRRHAHLTITTGTIASYPSDVDPIEVARFLDSCIDVRDLLLTQILPPLTWQADCPYVDRQCEVVLSYGDLHLTFL